MAKRYINWHDDAQKEVADILRADPWFTDHRCAIVERESKDMLRLVETALDQLDGPVVIAGVDSMTNNYPAVEVELSCEVTEAVASNRLRDRFATAMQVAQRVVQDIDGPVWRWQDTREEEPEQWALRATAKFRGLRMANGAPVGG